MAAIPTRPIVVAASTVLVGLLLIGGVGVLADDGVASAAHEGGDSPDWVHEANFTLKFTNPTPGEETGAVLWASLPDSDHYGEGLEEGKFVELWLPQSFSGSSSGGPACSREHVVVAGIDRGANNSGTSVDMSLVSNVKNYGIDQNAAGQTHAIVEAYGRNDFGGDHVAAHYSDEAVVKIDGCLVTPEETGWYRAGFYANGTNYQKEYVGASGYTGYVPICDCENREEAIETLGEPPEKGIGTEGTIIRADSDGVYGETLDGGPPASWDLEAKQGAGASEDQGSESTPDGSSDGSGSNAGSSDGSASTPEPTAEDDSDGSDSNAGDAEESTPEPTAEGGSDGSDSNSGGSEESASNQDGSEGGNQPGTPTASDGPGFGALVALAGLLASTLLLYRRD